MEMEVVMRTALMLLLCLLLAATCLGQSASAKWQVATITEAKVHPPTAGDDSSTARYDVTVRVEKTEYVVLYVAPDGSLPDTARYRLGQDVPVLVGIDTIKYNDMTGTTREVPILSRRNIPTVTTAKKPDGKR
jgi:hypothetical protein